MGMMKPQTFMEAFEVAVLQELAVELSSMKFKANAKWSGDPRGQNPKKNTGCAIASSNPKSTNNSPGKPKRISTQEVQCRRNLGLCFKCGEKYGFGHQCSLKGSSFMILEEDDESEEV